MKSGKKLSMRLYQLVDKSKIFVYKIISEIERSRNLIRVHNERRKDIIDSRDRKRERRVNPRSCVLCDGPMRPDKRPPRNVMYPDGNLRSLPEEILDWHICGRCGKSQVGVVRP